MNTDEIRSKFIRYFEGQGHVQVASSSLVVQGDPSVLLTSAGMQQFKPYYVDPTKAPSRRIVTVQRCMRTSDIDEVGDNTHHSFFEMLGNFAFGGREEGGYFKQEAVAFAHELVTRDYGIELSRLWATTWAGEPGLPADDEALRYWQAVGIPRERIRPLNRKPDGSRENFWGPTGDSGPCGPCSELHADLLGRCPLGLPDDACGPGGRWVTADGVRYDHDCGRFVEIWNLVFNQYYQEFDKSLRPLPHTGIDTGSGLERVALVLQGVASTYDTDLLKPMVEKAASLLDAPYGEDEQVTRAVRIVVDHTRAVTFMISDGVFPSNVERGYVARRLLRRAVRYGRQLGRRGPFMVDLARATIERMAPYYPHLKERQALIEETIAREEARFSETLASGSSLLTAELDRLERAGERVLPGRTAFRLYDTFGFPFELTQEAAAARGFDVDADAFLAELLARQKQSQAGGKFRGLAEVDLPTVEVAFVGYDALTVDGATVEFVRQGTERVTTAGADTGGEVWVVLDRTPFYAERGGQVGDTGRIVGPHGEMVVETTQAPLGDVIVHIGRVVRGTISQGERVTAEVAGSERRATMRHHTATHLLHAALRNVLGPHVHQAGSLVAPDRLRFDFTHSQPLTPDQRRAIQRRVNDEILRNVEVRTEILPLDAALRSGAVALFDEKYGDAVRVVSVGDFSKELCGGTHVRRSGDLGVFVLAGESSIGSGLRRVEAYAGVAAEEYAQRQADLLEEAARAAGTAREELPARIEQLRNEVVELRRQLEAAERKASQQGLGDLLSSAQDVPAKDGTAFKLLAAQVDPASAPTRERLREMADWLRDKLGGPSVLLLGSVVESRPQLLTMVSPVLTRHGLHAGKLLNEAAQAMGGRGGGKPELAQGGGGDPAKLPQALERGRQAVLAQAV